MYCLHCLHMCLLVFTCSWHLLLPMPNNRGSDTSKELPNEDGAEVEVFTSAAPAAVGVGASSGGGGRGDAASRQQHKYDGRLSDQDVYTGDYEVAVGGGQALMW